MTKTLIAAAVFALALLGGVAFFVLPARGAPLTQRGPIARPTPTPVSSAVTPALLLRRTTTRQETRRFGYGGTVTIHGAPAGSITIEAWQRSEVEIVAEIEWQAATEEDLARLSTVNNFAVDHDANRIRVMTTGTHDRQFMRRAARDFPRRLMNLPWRIDYRIRMPAMTDVEIFAGHGPITFTGVEGALRLTAIETDATLAVSGGDIDVRIGGGSVIFRPTARSWRGRGADIRLATGTLTVELPPAFNADINAEVLRAGRIENTADMLVPRERETPTERALRARAGSGGATLSFTVGDGTLRFKTVTGDR